MRQLIVVFVDKLPEPEVEFERVAVFGGDEGASGEGDVHDWVDMVVEGKGERNRG